ncbi:MAG: ATP-binding protein, partial [Gammaproteobacteria bacterium]
NVLVNTPLLRDGLRLVATQSAINCAGLFVVSTLNKWGVRGILLDAVLVTEELVTNAVRATGVMEARVDWNELTRIEFITVRLLGFKDSIRIEVWDSAPNPPPLADDAGSSIKRDYYPAPRGKVVWAELSLAPEHRNLPTPPPEQFRQDPDTIRRVRDGLEDL